MKHSSRGITVVLALAFGALILVVVSSFAGVVIGQAKLGRAKVAQEGALHVAEAGINYYDWFLAQYPDDTQDGTGGAGPYVHQFDDPETGRIGEFILDIVGNRQCGVLQSVDITSTGSIDTHPSITRTVSARRMQPTVAEYAQVFGDKVWFGGSSNVVGVVHANNGVRMDGAHNSLVQAGAATWTCTSTYGCDPDETVEGVFGAGGPQNLWQYPVGTIDFSEVNTNTLALESAAQVSGIHLADFTSGDESQGYHLVFQSNGTVDVYQVTASSAVWAYHSSYGGWKQVYDVITTESFVSTYTIDSACGLLFSEEKLWIEGVVNGRLAVVAARSGSYDPDILLAGDITYAGSAGDNGISVLAENNILFPHNGPEDHELQGVYTAIEGRFGRDYYHEYYVGTTHALKDSLTITGTVVSNLKPGSVWTSGGTPVSGFTTRNYYYDAALIPNPPPFTPTTSEVYDLYTWREE